MHNRAKYAGFVTILISTLGFQNCTNASFTLGVPPVQQGGGNGDSYGGITTYYSLTDHVVCPLAPVIPVSVFVASIIEIAAQDDTATLINPCTGEKKGVGISDLAFSGIHSEILKFDGKLYDGLVSPPKYTSLAEISLPILSCSTLWVGINLGDIQSIKYHISLHRKNNALTANFDREIVNYGSAPFKNISPPDDLVKFQDIAGRPSYIGSALVWTLTLNAFSSPSPSAAPQDAFNHRLDFTETLAGSPIMVNGAPVRCLEAAP